MMKRLIALWAAVMLLCTLPALAAGNAYELIENAMYRLVLRTEEGDVTLGGAVLFLENRLLLTAAGCLREGDLYAIGTDGEHAILAGDTVPDSGVALLEMAEPSASTPLHLAVEDAAGMACIFALDGSGAFVVAPLNQLRNTLYHEQEAMLLSSSDGLLPGGFLTDENGNLIGLTLAQQGEGQGEYLSLDANGLYRALTREQYADAFLPVEAAYEAGLLTLTWTDEDRGEGMYLVTLSADDNVYYTFFQADHTQRSLELPVSPGHRYDFQVQWVLDAAGAIEPVWGAMSTCLVPTGRFTRYDYAQECRVVTRTDEHAPLKDVAEITYSLLTDKSLLRYIQVDSTYAIDEQVQLPMTVELLTPSGQFYYESALRTFSPDKAEEDAFLLSLDDLLTDCMDFSGGTLPYGQYTVSYAISGGVAGEFTFTLTEETDTPAALPVEEGTASGFITPLHAEYENGAVTLTWPAEAVPEGATVDVYYLFEGNTYYTYHRMEEGQTQAELFTVPGRETLVWAVWSLEPLAEAPIPQEEGEYVAIPPVAETAFTLNGFENQRLSLAPSADPAAGDKTEFLPEVTLTREILANQEVPLYFQTEDTYQVNENSSGHPMMLVLCTPEGSCFAYPLEYLFDVNLQTSDLWLFDVSSLCRNYEAMVPSAWSAGDYRFLYCIDGQVAGEICFTLE